MALKDNLTNLDAIQGEMKMQREKTDTETYRGSHKQYTEDQLSILKSPTYTQHFPISQLKVGSYQRTPHIGRIKEMGRHLFEGTLSAIEVNIRNDGAIYIVDGQHRHRAALLAGKKDLLCIVREGLTEKQEAFLFKYLNKNRQPVSPMSNFKAELIEETPSALEILKVIGESGYHLDLDETYKKDENGYISCIGTLSMIYRGGEHVHGRNPSRLAKVLNTLHAIWPTQKGGTGSVIVAAMDMLLWRYRNDTIDMSRLVERLRYLDPNVVLKTAAARHGVGLGDQPKTLVVHELVKTYNSHLRSNRLISPLNGEDDRRKKGIVEE